VLITSCAISAGIHAALAPEHFREEPGAGGGFLVSAVLLAVLCVVLVYRPGSRVAVGAAAATLAGLLVAYALVLAVGVPVLHPDREPAEGLALVTKAIELVGLVAAVGLAAPGVFAGRFTRPLPRGTR
jgi:hypothetical protein